MRIAFSGTANSGKSTMVKSFLHTWTNYETPTGTYRDVLKEKGLEIHPILHRKHKQLYWIF